MDIYYTALDKGQASLAAACKQKAAQCEEELVFSGVFPAQYHNTDSWLTFPCGQSITTVDYGHTFHVATMPPQPIIGIHSMWLQCRPSRLLAYILCGYNAATADY